MAQPGQIKVTIEKAGPDQCPRCSELDSAFIFAGIYGSGTQILDVVVVCVHCDGGLYIP